MNLTNSRDKIQYLFCLGAVSRCISSLHELCGNLDRMETESFKMATKNLLRHLQSRRGLDPFHSYFHHSGAATLRLAFWDWTLRVKGCRNSQSPGIIFSSQVMLTALFGRVLRTSISIKSDTAYLQMRCAWTIWNLNILQTSLGFVVWKSCGWRHSWNLPWLPERPATVTKTLVTLAGFLRRLLRHFFFLPMVFLSE